VFCDVYAVVDFCSFDLLVHC